MKQITEYIQKKHISKIDYNVDDLYKSPISYNGLLIRAEQKDTIKRFNDVKHIHFNSASEFVECLTKLWDELPKEKNKIHVAELYYHAPDRLGFTLYTHNNSYDKTLFWLDKKNTWGVSAGNYTYCYNTHKEIFENILLDL